MADYTKTTWVDEVTKVGPTNLNKMEDGIKDAAEHQNAGLLSARPPADAAHKHHIWRASDTGEAFYCDGTNWMPLAPTTRSPGTTQRATAPAPSFGAPADEALPAYPSYAATKLTIPAGSGGRVNVIRARVARSGTITGGSIVMELRANFVDPMIGDVPGASLGFFVGPRPAFDLSTSQADYTFQLQPVDGASPIGAQVNDGDKVWVCLSTSGLSGGGSVLYDTRASLLGIFYDAVGPSFLAGSSFGPITLIDNPPAHVVRAGGNDYADTFRVEGPLSERRYRIDASGNHWLNEDLLLSNGGLSELFARLKSNLAASGSAADILKQWVSSISYGPSIRAGQKLVTATGTNILSVPEYPLAGLFLVHATRAADGANMAFAVGAVDCSYYRNTLTMLYNSSWTSSVASNFTTGGAASGSGQRTVVMTSPGAIGNANATVVFIGFIGQSVLTI